MANFSITLPSFDADTTQDVTSDYGTNSNPTSSANSSVNSDIDSECGIVMTKEGEGNFIFDLTTC